MTHPLHVIMRSAMAGAKGDLALVSLRVDDERLAIHAGIGPLAEDMVGNVMLVQDSVAAPVLLHGTPTLIPDYARDGAATPEVRVQIGSVIIAALLLPGGQIGGALAVGRLSGAPSFVASDLNQLCAFIERVGIGRELANAHEERRVARLIEDRSRIRDDLHDHVIQELFATGMALQSAGDMVTDPDQRALIAAQVDALDATTRRIRRLISNLPDDDTSRTTALPKRLVAIVDSMTPALRCLPTVSFVGPVEASVSPAMAADMEAVLREALSNVARHAGASAVQVRVAATEADVVLEVVDDGRGIGATDRSSGLSTMRRRAERHGGRLELTQPSGGGTRLCWTVPREL